MSRTAAYLKKNISIFVLWIIISGAIIGVWISTETASLTDVFLDKNDIYSDDADILRTKSTSTTITTLKHYYLNTWSTLRIDISHPDSISSIEDMIESSYWFFIENNDTHSIITLYLPSEIERDARIVEIDTNSIVVDSILLFHDDTVDELRIQQINKMTSH